MATGCEAEDGAQVVHDGATRPARIGKTIFDYADEFGVPVPTSCSRTGQCHECVVEIRHGMKSLSPRTESEAFLQDRYRLACQAVVQATSRPIEFRLLRRSPKILLGQPSRSAELDPPVTRQGAEVACDGKRIDSFRGHLLGIALDVGTTTCVAELVDLQTGSALAANSFENPQRFGGSNVMHRISYDAGSFQGELHRAIINTLNREIAAMCARIGGTPNEIYEIVVVGNTTMRELFFGHDVQSIGKVPFKALVELEQRAGKRTTTALVEPASSLGIHAGPGARVYAPPLVACHVGTDVTADLVAIDIESQTELVMLIDAGTNTEVVVGNKDRLLAASCPSGPAFEGGQVRFGMPGHDGAIESVRYADGRFQYDVIGQTEPRGLCGSGLIDLLAELTRHNLMTPACRFVDGQNERLVAAAQGITFSRQDAAELSLAKAANYAGQVIVMRRFGVSADQISKLYLAGGFANYVNSRSAIDIGFLPPVPEDRIVKIGNAAAQGAREMLLSKRKRAGIDRLVGKIEHVELETVADFFDVFVEGCLIQPMKIPAAESR